MNLEESRKTIREMDIEQAEHGALKCEEILTRVKAEIAALPQSPGLTRNLGHWVRRPPTRKLTERSQTKAEIEWLLNEYRQRIAELQTGAREPNRIAGNASDGDSNRFLTSAQRKLDDPKKFPTMDPKEVMAVLGLSKSAVYDHLTLQRVSTGTRSVLFKTKSVKAVQESSPE
jgi:predicted DNA-binding transcriptional regulator AlpA